MNIKKSKIRFLKETKYLIVLFSFLFMFFSCEFTKLENTDENNKNQSINNNSKLIVSDTDLINVTNRCAQKKYEVTLVLEKDGIIEERVKWLNEGGYEQQGIFRYKKGLTKKSPSIIFIPGGGPTAAYNLTYSVIQKELINHDYVVFEFGKRGVIIDENDEIHINQDIYNTIDPGVLYNDTGLAFEMFKTHDLVDNKRMAAMGQSESSLIAPMLANTYTKEIECKIKYEIKCLAIFSPVGVSFLQTCYDIAVEDTIYYLKKYIDIDNDDFITPEEYENVNGSLIFVTLGMIPKFTDVDINNDNKISISEMAGYLTVLTDFLIASAYPDKPTVAWGAEQFTNNPFYSEPNYERIARYKNPILLIAGKEDRTTPMHKTLSGEDMGATLIKNYVLDSGHEDFTYYFFDGLGHSLVPMTGKFNEDEFSNRGKIPQYVLDAFVDWFDQKLKK